VEFETLVQSRRSVRGFKNEKVERTVIEAIIESAKRAPSSMNTQPWHVHVLTGSPLEEVRSLGFNDEFVRYVGFAD
jgi:nitroreductase